MYVVSHLTKIRFCSQWVDQRIKEAEILKAQCLLPYRLLLLPSRQVFKWLKLSGPNIDNFFFSPKFTSVLLQPLLKALEVVWLLYCTCQNYLIPSYGALEKFLGRSKQALSTGFPLFSYTYAPKYLKYQIWFIPTKLWKQYSSQCI